MKPIEKILHAFFAAARARSADIPVCGFWGLSSPQFRAMTPNTELESSVNPQTRMSALRTAKPSSEQRWLRGVVITLCASALFSGCAVGPNYKAPQTTVAASFANSPTNVVSADEAALATWWKGFNDV